MSKINQFNNNLMKLFEKLSPIVDKLANNDWMRGLSAGMMSTLPISVLGSFSLLFVSIPSEGLKNFLESTNLAPVFDTTFRYTLGMLSVYMVIFITKSIVSMRLKGDDGISAAAAAFISFLILTPQGILESTGSRAIPFQWLGAEGAFCAIIVAIITSRIYIFFKENNIIIKMPNGVPPMVANVFAGIIPTIVIAVLFMGINYLVSLTSFGNLHQAIYSMLQAPMQQLGGSLGALLFVSLVINILWFFGLHGQNIITPFIMSVWLTLDMQNMQALAAGQVAPNIIGNAFYSLINFGGYQLALIFLLMRSRSKQLREIGKLTVGPALFGIGEPLNFGLPLSYNFKFIVPFLTNSLLMLTLSYFAIKSGLVPAFNGSAHIFGLPIGVGAFLQGGWRTFALQIVTQILPIILWYPWFKMVEKDALALENGSSDNSIATNNTGSI